MKAQRDFVNVKQQLPQGNTDVYALCGSMYDGKVPCIAYIDQVDGKWRLSGEQNFLYGSNSATALRVTHWRDL